MKLLHQIKIGKCTATFTSIEPCLGDARVSGWVTAPNKDQGFAFCAQVAAKLGRKHLGAVCSLETTPADFAFSFDVRPQYLWPQNRYEFKEEVVARVARDIQTTH